MTDKIKVNSKVYFTVEQMGNSSGYRVTIYIRRGKNKRYMREQTSGATVQELLEKTRWSLAKFKEFSQDNEGVYPAQQVEKAVLTLTHVENYLMCLQTIV